MEQIENGSIWWVNLKGSNLPSEISKVRPCLIISKTKWNNFSNFITVLPISSKLKLNGLHIDIIVNNKKGQIISYLIHVISKHRLISKITNLNQTLLNTVTKNLNLLYF